MINVNGDTPGQKIMLNGKSQHEYSATVFNMKLGSRLGALDLSLPARMSAGLPVCFSARPAKGRREYPGSRRGRREGAGLAPASN